MWVWYKLSRSRAGGAPSLPVVIVISQARQTVHRDPIHTYHTPIPSYRTWISGSPKTVSHAASCCLLGWLVWGRFRRSVRTAQTHVQHASLFHSASLVVGALHLFFHHQHLRIKPPRPRHFFSQSVPSPPARLASSQFRCKPMRTGQLR